MRRTIAAMLTSLALLAACGGGDDPGTSASQAPSGSPAAATSTAVATGSPASDEGAEPSLAIRSPADGDEVSGPSVTVRLDVGGFAIVNEIGGNHAPGEGHIHYYLDVEEIPTTAGEEAIVEGEGRYVATPADSYTWNGLTPGRHILGAQLIRNDHTPLEPPVTASVTITVTD